MICFFLHVWVKIEEISVDIVVVQTQTEKRWNGRMTIEENDDLKELSVQTSDQIHSFILCQNFHALSKHLCLGFYNWTLQFELQCVVSS